MTARLGGMLSTERLAWERAKVEAGLYGFPDEAGSKGAKVFRTGMWSCPLCSLRPNELSQSICSTRAQLYSLSSLLLSSSQAPYIPSLESIETQRIWYS